MLKKLFLVIALCGAILPAVAVVNGLLQYKGAWVSGVAYKQLPLQGSNVLLYPVVKSGGAMCALVNESQLNVNESPNAQPAVWDCDL